MESYLFAEMNNLKEPWSHTNELLSQILEVSVNINQEKGAKPYESYRPFPKGSGETVTDEEQAQIDALLSPVDF